jgi:hypothetical protein
MSTRAELERLWTEVRARLESAAALLPETPHPADRGGAIQEYREFLAHNELGLAFDALETVGLVSEVPDAYWRELASAADLMRLRNRAEACRSRIRSST